MCGGWNLPRKSAIAIFVLDHLTLFGNRSRSRERCVVVPVLSAAYSGRGRDRPDSSVKSFGPNHLGPTSAEEQLNELHSSLWTGWAVRGRSHRTGGKTV